MSKDIETELAQHALCEFWGGSERGVCVQVTPLFPSEAHNGYILLDLKEAAELAYQLSQYCLREAQRRQDLLKEQVKELVDLQKTVFQEVSEIRLADYGTQKTVVDLVSKFAPTSKLDHVLDACMMEARKK